MKTKLIFSLVIAPLFFILSGAKAQLPDGSIAPNFTVTDINGNSHTLYDILDSGYAVVMDLNATWCGPCWTYHQDGHLETLWEEHGPAGWPGVNSNTTNDVFVFMIESDNNTDMADLNGSGDNTYGDWITGTHFPIIDDGSVAQAYELSYYPTVFTVCPNRVLTESGTLSSSQHYGIVGNCKSAESGKNMAAFDYTGEKTTCGTEVDVKARFHNMGTEAISSFTAEVLDGGNTIGTQQYSGNTIETYDLVELDFGTLTIDGNSNLEIKITTDDVLTSDNTLTQSITLAKEGNGNMILKVTTDNFGSQVTWKIKNANSNTVVASGGPYGNSSDNQNYDAQPQDDDTISMSTDGCYFFEVYDSQSNGMYNFPQSDEGPSFFKLVNGDGMVLFELFGDEYKASTRRKFLYKTTLSVQENNSIKNTTLYPNPSHGTSMLQVDMFENDDRVALSIYNVMGEKVMTKTISLYSGTNTIPLKTEQLETGLYTVELKSSSIHFSQKLIKIK